MPLRRVLVLVLAVATVGTATCSGAPARYARWRQAVAEDIPGTLDYRLLPADGFEPSIGPGVAYDGLPGADTEPNVMVTLAVVENERGTWPPSWVFFTRGLCYFTAKGDLVSPGRSGEDPCTHENMLVQVVDASSGDVVGVFSAFDAEGSWAPERQAAVPDRTRFH